MGEITAIPRVIPTLTEYQRNIIAKIKTYLEQTKRFAITDSNIFQLVMEHNGAVNVSRMTVQIGDRFLENEPIIAIFGIKEWYLVCTKSMGALTGSPKYIDGCDVIEIVKFREILPTSS